MDFQAVKRTYADHRSGKVETSDSRDAPSGAPTSPEKGEIPDPEKTETGDATDPGIEGQDRHVKVPIPVIGRRPIERKNRKIRVAREGRVQREERVSKGRRVRRRRMRSGRPKRKGRHQRSQI